MSASDLPDSVIKALTTLADVEHLLVASDYDGCVAPIVSRPSDARPNPDSIHALATLATCESTTAAVISGRALADLEELSGLDSSVHKVGSHGSEFDTGFAAEITPAARDLLATLIGELDAIAIAHKGVTIETKPVSVALHVRNAEPSIADAALREARIGPAKHAGVQTTEGKAVIELAVIDTDKGFALTTLRKRFGADAAVYFGDDVTDEKAFAVLRPGIDLGIKVGDGRTLAEQRIADTDAAAAALTLLAQLRSTL